MCEEPFLSPPASSGAQTPPQPACTDGAASCFRDVATAAPAAERHAVRQERPYGLFHEPTGLAHVYLAGGPVSACERADLVTRPLPVPLGAVVTRAAACGTRGELVAERVSPSALPPTAALVSALGRFRRRGVGA